MYAPYETLKENLHTVKYGKKLAFCTKNILFLDLLT
jgi:hypothetical protein